jgi:hypothetical protein
MHRGLRVVAGRVAVWSVALAVVFSSGQTRAEDADALVARANELRKDGRDQDALPLFQQAMKQRRTPKVLTQVGLCEQAMGLWVSAETHLHEALAYAQDPWIQKNQPAIREALSFVQDRLGDLEVWGTPAGATVAIDNVTVAKLPMTNGVRVAVGNRILTISAPAFAEETRAIEVKSGAHVREHVVLVPVPAKRVIVHPPNAEAPVEASVPLGTDAVPPMPAPEAADSGPFYTRWWFWTVVGSAVVAGGVTAYFVVGRNDSCTAPMGGACGRW